MLWYVVGWVPFWENIEREKNAKPGFYNNGLRVASNIANISFFETHLGHLWQFLISHILLSVMHGHIDSIFQYYWFLP